MHRNRFRPSLLLAAIASTYGVQAHAAPDTRFYIAPMASYALADDDRHTKDGLGGTLAFGAPLTSQAEIELLGSYLHYKGKDDGDSDKLTGGGVGINFFGSKLSGPYLHGDIMASQDAKPVVNVGLGFYAYVTKGFAIRAEALYHNDDLATFREPLFNLGVRIPIGSVPEEPALPPRAPEPVAVVPPVTPPPACSDMQDNDGDGKVDYPADPGCTSADDPDETDPPPKCPAPAPGEPVTLEGCQAGDVLVLRGVNFDFDKSTLTPNAKTILDDVATALVARPDIAFEIGGHTDAKGSDEYNQKLSERRSKSVLDYLAKKGVDPKRMTSRGYGESMPVADNGTDEGRELNRRVELKITASSGAVSVAPTTAEAATAPASASAPVAAAPPAAVVLEPMSAPAAAAGAFNVTIANFAFSPETVTVAVGSTVTWTNSDGTPHSVKFADQGDSGKFGKGGTFKRTFDAPGVYDYTCGIHATMKGRVIVQ